MAQRKFEIIRDQKAIELTRKEMIQVYQLMQEDDEDIYLLNELRERSESLILSDSALLDDMRYRFGKQLDYDVDEEFAVEFALEELKASALYQGRQSKTQ